MAMVGRRNRISADPTEHRNTLFAARSAGMGLCREPGCQRGGCFILPSMRGVSATVSRPASDPVGGAPKTGRMAGGTPNPALCPTMTTRSVEPDPASVVNRGPHGRICTPARRGDQDGALSGLAHRERRSRPDCRPPGQTPILPYDGVNGRAMPTTHREADDE